MISHTEVNRTSAPQRENARPNALTEKLNSVFALYHSEVCALTITESKETPKHIHRDKR